MQTYCSSVCWEAYKFGINSLLNSVLLYKAAFDHLSAMTKTACLSPVLGEGRKYKRHTKGTYIGLIAYVIQDSPNKMLTFKQVGEGSTFNYYYYYSNIFESILVNQRCCLFVDYEEIGHVCKWG